MKIRKTLCAIFLITTLSGCHPELFKSEFKIRPVSSYEAEGAAFYDAKDLEKFEKDQYQISKKKTKDCETYVLKKAKEFKLNKTQITEQQAGCAPLFSNVWLTRRQWLEFRNKYQAGDKIYTFGKRSVNGHGGYSGYALVREGMVIATYYSIVS